MPDNGDGGLGHARSDRAAVLEAISLSCSFGGVRAVVDVSLDVREQEFVGLIGPNGAGKSTLLSCMSGENRDYSGTVRMFGVDVTRWSMARRARLGAARSFQNPRMFGRMSVLSNLMVAAKAPRGEHPFLCLLPRFWQSEEAANLTQARSLVSRFDLEPVEDSYAGEVSGGQERLVELARTLMSQPRLLLLDEPFAGVSPGNRRILAEHLQRLRERHGISILMVEHRLEWVQDLCDRVVVMAEGRVLANGDMGTILQRRDVVDAYLGRRTAADLTARIGNR